MNTPHALGLHNATSDQIKEFIDTVAVAELDTESTYDITIREHKRSATEGTWYAINRLLKTLGSNIRMIGRPVFCVNEDNEIVSDSPKTIQVSPVQAVSLDEFLKENSDKQRVFIFADVEASNPFVRAIPNGTTVQLRVAVL